LRYAVEIANVLSHPRNKKPAAGNRSAGWDSQARRGSGYSTAGGVSGRTALVRSRVVTKIHHDLMYNLGFGFLPALLTEIPINFAILVNWKNFDMIEI
jgi:hypothetical protein